MSNKIIAYGWYNHNNLGDDLMLVALQNLFKTKIIPTDNICSIKDCKGIIFGGGSILQDKPNINDDILSKLIDKEIPIYYIGIGKETSVHPVHQKLLEVAVIKKFRDVDIPDLVYSLNFSKNKYTNNKILIIPNVQVVPTWDEAHWKHTAWEHFKNEFAQSLDALSVTFDFACFCHNDVMTDIWPISEICARRKRNTKNNIIEYSSLLKSLSNLDSSIISNYNCIITQRYHGIVLAEKLGVPYIAICHHDKLKKSKPHRGNFLSYHSIQKSQIISAIENTNKFEPYNPDILEYTKGFSCFQDL